MCGDLQAAGSRFSPAVVAGRKQGVEGAVRASRTFRTSPSSCSSDQEAASWWRGLSFAAQTPSPKEHLAPLPSSGCFVREAFRGDAP